MCLRHSQSHVDGIASLQGLSLSREVLAAPDRTELRKVHMQLARGAKKRTFPGSGNAPEDRGSNQGRARTVYWFLISAPRIEPQSVRRAGVQHQGESTPGKFPQRSAPAIAIFGTTCG